METAFCCQSSDSLHMSFLAQLSSIPWGTDLEFRAYVPVAQWIARLPTEQEVQGSIPCRDSINTFSCSVSQRN